MNFKKFSDVGPSELSVRRPRPIKSTPKPGRNDLCHCGSGRKYKKCCLMLDSQKEQEKQNVKELASKITSGEVVPPTPEQAATWLKRYVDSRVMQHNAQVQCLSMAEDALTVLPESPERNHALADTKRRLSEIIGDSVGRETQVLRSLCKVMEDNAALVQKPKEPEQGVGQGPKLSEESQAAKTTAPEAEQKAELVEVAEPAAADELAKDAAEDSAVEKEIDEIVG